MTGSVAGEAPDNRLRQARDYFLLALWFGILAGLAEVTLLGVQRYAMGRFIFLTRDVVWMAPVANTLFASVAAGLLLLVVKLRGKHLTLAAAAAVFATLMFTAVLFMYPRMPRSTEMLLALGLGVTVGRIAGSYAKGFRTLIRRTAAALVVVVAASGVLLHGWLALRERRALRALPAAQAGAPNVLLIILDTVRSMNLGLYGYGRQTTPQLERLARAGVTYDHAYAAAPWTLPGHASMFTGRWPNEFTADWGTPLDGTWPTLAEELAKRGYVTSGIAANLLFCTWETGLDRGFAHWEDFPINLQQVFKSSSIARVATGQRWFKGLTGWRQRLARMSAADVDRSFLTWLGRAPRRPFFAFLNYLDAHAPYLPPAPYDTVFPPVRELKNPEADDVADWTPEEVSAALDAYDRSIAYLDDQIGRLLDSLQQRGVLENTLVIITSDHGEEFYEHALMGHGNSLYRPSVQIPLLVLFPGQVPAGLRVSVPVSNREIPATVLDFLGLAGASPFPGRSLARFWRAAPDDSTAARPDTVLSLVSFAKGLPRRYPVSRGDMSSITADGFRMIRNGDGIEELYDAGLDPWERLDLADSASAAPTHTRLRQGLKNALGPAWDHRKQIRGRQR